MAAVTDCILDPDLLRRHDVAGPRYTAGFNASAPQTFTLTVSAVNDAPSFAAGGNVTVLEDSGAYTAAWATGVSAGPANEAGQTLAFQVTTNNATLFAVAPAVSPAGPEPMITTSGAW